MAQKVNIYDNNKKPNCLCFTPSPTPWLIHILVININNIKNFVLSTSRKPSPNLTDPHLITPLTHPLPLFVVEMRFFF